MTKGSRVRLSPLGRAHFGWHLLRYPDRLGTVLRQPQGSGMIVGVLWDGKRKAEYYRRSWIEVEVNIEP